MLTVLVRDRYSVSLGTICYHTLIAIHLHEILIMYIHIRHGVSHYWTSHAKLLTIVTLVPDYWPHNSLLTTAVLEAHCSEVISYYLLSYIVG